MKFVVCNFLENNVLSRKVSRGVKRVIFDERMNSPVSSLVDSYLCKNDDGSVDLIFNQCGCAIPSEWEEFDVMGSLSSERIKSTDEELSHTPENPLILVATKSVKFFEGVPSYIKYIPVDGGVLIVLFKGCIAVESPWGEYVSLTRNITNIESVKPESHMITSKEFKDMNVLEDKESGVGYSDYVVSDCIISFVRNKSGLNRTLKFNKENFTILYSRVFEDGAKKKAKEREEKEALKLKKENEIAEYNKRRAERERLKAEEDRAKAEEKRSSKLNKKKSKEESVDYSGSEGAQAFLAFVNSLKG